MHPENNDPLAFWWILFFSFEPSPPLILVVFCFFVCSRPFGPEVQKNVLLFGPQNSKPKNREPPNLKTSTANNPKPLNPTLGLDRFFLFNVAGLRLAQMREQPQSSGALDHKIEVELNPGVFDTYEKWLITVPPCHQCGFCPHENRFFLFHKHF